MANTPRLSGIRSQQPEDLADCLESVFYWDASDSYSADILMVFNDIAVRLGWKYDVPIIIEELVDDLMTPLLAQPEGTSRVTWPSSSFRGQWDLEWRRGCLAVQADWWDVACGPAREPLEPLLNKNSTLRVDLPSFLTEWRHLLWAMIPVAEQAAPEVKQFAMWSRLRSVAGPQPIGFDKARHKP